METIAEERQMAEHPLSSRPGCILAVSGDPHRFDAVLDAVPQAAPAWTTYTRCPDAAARLARAPAELLILDTRLLGPGQMPLLRIARRENVAMVGLGPAPMGLGEKDIGDVARLDRAELIARLRSLLEFDPPGDESSRDAAETSKPPARSAAPHEQASQPPPQAQDQSQAQGPENAPVQPQNEQLSDEDLPEALCREIENPSQEISPSKVLSPEELAALLEDRS
jgi:hypothetical protein